MDFEIIGDVENQETFASGKGIRELSRLQRIYGKGKWRKRKGIADVKLSGGSIVRAELHWYAGTGIRKKELKIKRYVDRE